MVFGGHGQDAFVYMGGISAPEPVPIDSDHPQCAQSAKSVKIFQYQCVGSLFRCGYSGGSTCRTASHHNHIVAAQDRERTCRRVDESFLQGGAERGEQFACLPIVRSIHFGLADGGLGRYGYIFYLPGNYFAHHLSYEHGRDRPHHFCRQFP